MKYEDDELALGETMLRPAMLGGIGGGMAGVTIVAIIFLEFFPAAAEIAHSSYHSPRVLLQESIHS